MAELGLVFMGVGLFGGMASGGYNAWEQQNQIKQQFCQLDQQMEQYKQNMIQNDQILNYEAAQAQTQAQNLAIQVSTTISQIQLAHTAFKETYNRWVVIGVSFLIVLIFLLASKKLILHATTEAS